MCFWYCYEDWHEKVKQMMTWFSRYAWNNYDFGSFWDSGGNRNFMTFKLTLSKYIIEFHFSILMFTSKSFFRTSLLSDYLKWSKNGLVKNLIAFATLIWHKDMLNRTLLACKYNLFAIKF